MATKPVATEAIALTEKKMDMALDDIIKMSKNKGSKSNRQQRVPNKSQKNFKNAAQQKSFKVQQYMDSRSSLRQGVLARRRSNFKGNQFPFAYEVAQKAAVGSLRGRPFNRRAVPVSNKARVGSFMVRRPANSNVAPKPVEGKQQQGISGAKQRPQTLDSLFANMKEQRMRKISSQNNAVRHNGGGGQPRVPWARGRFGN
ncbi:UAP56-interacting factor-like isoform X2 [Tripterygium wilfordii]|uniref:UAP56-interacting factor-like isoform X2 n=1 Tax=Tripterygium wilfordii TaxID=458696 RepID=UPI0018F85609|nr:UAP56-interacting factor-like isoform X2 [Tripterygium wilfordii]